MEIKKYKKFDLKDYREVNLTKKGCLDSFFQAMEETNQTFIEDVEKVNNFPERELITSADIIHAVGISAGRHISFPDTPWPDFDCATAYLMEKYSAEQMYPAKISTEGEII